MVTTRDARDARGTLAPTASYLRREWLWLPADPPADALGTLTLLVTRGRRVIRTQLDHYAVQEELDLGLPAGVRAFLLENETRPDPYGPFRCVVGGMAEWCGCEMGWFDGRRVQATGCKHRDSIRQMIVEGVI